MSHQQEASSSSSSSNQPVRWQYSEFDDSNFQIRGRTLFFLIVLLSVILLVVLLFLYARWVCRYPPPHPPPAPPLDALRPSPPPPRRGLDAAAISSLPIVLHRAEHGSSAAECCICLGVFDDGDKVKALPQCRHSFHSECVDTWLTARSTCPLCRASVRIDPPV